jgi:hypothetical protein
MKIESVEIFSDQPNSMVVRLPGRAFPGMLIPGDSLHVLCQRADRACEDVGRGAAGYDELNRLRNTLWSYLDTYKTALDAHEIRFPFSD